MEKKITKLALDPNEMAIRKIYWPLLKTEKLTTVFRPGKRLEGDERGYRKGQIVDARVIDYIGADWAGVPPEFAPQLSKKIIIESVEAKKIGELSAQDFIGSSPDIFNQQSLIYHLGVVYNLFPEDLNPNSLVTIINFKYIAMSKEIEKLVKDGIITLAKEPQDNVHELNEVSRYTISFAEHDYHAKTPVMWNAAYREFGIGAKSVMFVARPENLDMLLGLLRKDARYLGGGMGVGFKDEVMSHLDEVDDFADQIGAVNIVVKTVEHKLKGYNTDGTGFVDSLQHLLAKTDEVIADKKIVILGAGGTGNAIAFSLAKYGANIVILNRTVATAQDLAEKINTFLKLQGTSAVRFGGESEIEKEVSDADIVLNVSTKGSIGKLEEYSALASAQLPATAENIAQNLTRAKIVLNKIPAKAIVADVILRSGETPFLKSAKEAGFVTLNGIPMVINQGVEALWLIHGKELVKKGVTKDDVFSVMKKAADFQ